VTPGYGTVDMWTAPDGTRLALRRSVPAGRPRGLVVFVHGWGDCTGRWSHLAQWCNEHGLAFYAADQRGHGQTPGRRGHVERFAQYLADLAALRKLAAAEVPAPHVVLGHSFGGFIVLRYLETSPAGLAGAIAATPYVDLYEQPARWKTVLAGILRDVVPSLPIATGLDYDAISRDPEVVRIFREDPLCHQVMTPRAYTEAMANLQTLDAERDRIATPLLVLLAGDDRIVSTPAAEAFARRLAGDVTVRTYAGLYHNIFHEPNRGPVLDDLVTWLARILPGRAAA